jgi:hypothetical protein
MGVFKNKKHSSSLYKVVESSIKADPMISRGNKKQSKQTSAGDRKYDPMLSFSGNQGLSVKGTIDQMIMKAIK